MPQGVMDAFKSQFLLDGCTVITNVLQDLIRHGKNHHQTTKQHHHVPQDLHEPHQLQPVTVQPVRRHHHPTSAPYAKEAELIVQEEREAKSKMPLYKGLERFKLIDKMGESVLQYSLRVVIMLILV